MGSSSSRHVGRVVMIVARASRVRWPPDRVPTVRSGSRWSSPSRAAATEARRSASHASWTSASSSACSYASSPSAVPTPAASRSTSATAVRSGSRVIARTSATDGPVPERRLLPEQHQVGRCLHGPGDLRTVGEPAGHGPQEGRLADAVLPQQPDPAARLGDEVDAGQDGAPGIGDGEPGHDEGCEGGGGSGMRCPSEPGGVTRRAGGRTGAPPRTRVGSVLDPHGATSLGQRGRTAQSFCGGC